MPFFHSIEQARALTSDSYALESAAVKPLSVQRIDWHQPAQRVVEYFQQQRSAFIRVSPSSSLQETEQRLLQAHVRQALVVGHHQELLGLLALHQLHSRRSVVLAEQTQRPWAALEASDLMVNLKQLPVIPQTALQDATIGDVVATMQQFGSDYVLVSEARTIIGLVHSITIAERTGESVRLYHRASSFGEIVQAVRHPEWLTAD